MLIKSIATLNIIDNNILLIQELITYEELLLIF